MEIQKQNNIPCLSIEQMEELQELGIETSNATFAWVVTPSEAIKPFYTLKCDAGYFTDSTSIVVPAFGLIDMLSLLPVKLQWHSYSSGCGKPELGDFSFTLKETCETDVQDHFKLTCMLSRAFDRIVSGERPLDVAFSVLKEFAEKGYLVKI